MQVNVLRELFRNLRSFQVLYEDYGIGEITNEGVIYTLWDIQYLYEARLRLPQRQRQAIEMCLYDNMREVDAAALMGVSKTNPVAMYATDGLRRICSWIDDGTLVRYQERVREVA